MDFIYLFYLFTIIYFFYLGYRREVTLSKSTRFGDVIECIMDHMTSQYAEYHNHKNIENIGKYRWMLAMRYTVLHIITSDGSK